MKIDATWARLRISERICNDCKKLEKLPILKRATPRVDCIRMSTKTYWAIIKNWFPCTCMLIAQSKHQKDLIKYKFSDSFCRTSKLWFDLDLDGFQLWSFSWIFWCKSSLIWSTLKVLTSLTFLHLIRATALKSPTFETFPNGNFIISIVTVWNPLLPEIV